jgi:DNA-binding NarL/FixJ family response regulator
MRLDEVIMIDVSIIEDDQELRESLAVLLGGTPGFDCVSAYGDCETALKNLAGDQPDVILLDIEFGPHNMSGIEAAWHLKQILPKAEIIMMTVRADHESVFQALKNGANGYLVKDVPPAELLSAIETISKGGSPMSMSIARLVTDSFHRHRCFDQLTARQREVLDKLCKGKSYKAIANELYIDLSTVKFHIRNIYELLQVTNKTEAVLKYMYKK